MKIITKIKSTKEAIIETIAFFDLFMYPLTASEILKYLSVESTYLGVCKSLDELLATKTIETRQGLFFLPGKSPIIEERKKRYNYSDRKFKIAIGVSKIFRFVPWVRLICVANQMGDDNFRDESDIDLFILTDGKRTWITRFFLVIIAKTLNIRPRVGYTRDKICLSFYASEGESNLQRIKNTENDIYFEHWLLNLSPIYSKEDAFDLFMKANYPILNKYPNYRHQNISNRRSIRELNNKFYKKNINLLFGGLENSIKKIQIKKIYKNLRKEKSLSGVLIEDEIIKLHLKDRRTEFREKFEKNLEKIINV